MKRVQLPKRVAGFPRGEDEEQHPRVLHALVVGQRRETNGDRGSDWTPEEGKQERERGKVRRELLGGIVRYIGSPRQVVFFSCRMTQSREELPDRISRGGPLPPYKAPVRS